MPDKTLSFTNDGTFRIVQFNDTQDDHLTDRRTIDFMGRVLDQERPDFAVINGDVINGRPTTAREVSQAINNVVLPMESRAVPWALTFGNHDEDSLANGTGVHQRHMLDFARQYRHNLNPAHDADHAHGSSNARLLIDGSSSAEPVFAVWLLDSGRYAPDSPTGQSTAGLHAYHWLQPDQVQWYRTLSLADEQRHGRTIPGLMYFHIPTFEHHHMWYGQQFGSEDAGHEEAARRHGIVGVKNEDICTGLFNSGIYAAAAERGDVLGMYCGHDHINTFMGDYYGIELGYGPGTGFGAYGLNHGSEETHTLRGARIFELDENTERIYTATRTVFAQDLGLDMDPRPHKLPAPHDFPDYVRPLR